MTIDEIHNRIAVVFISIIIGSMLLGCSPYGKRIHLRNNMCRKCSVPLVEKCKPIDKTGKYKCKCLNCGNVAKYSGKSSIPSFKRTESNGIKTNATDEKWK
jgi:hypothetical protein